MKMDTKVIERGFLVSRKGSEKIRVGDWWRYCNETGMPNVKVFVGPVGSKYADVFFNADSMTQDRWSPKFTEETQNTLNKTITHAVHNRGSRIANAGYGGSRGYMQSIRVDAAMSFAWWFVRLCGNPESWQYLLNPMVPDGARVDNKYWRDLRFDWMDQLESEPSDGMLVDDIEIVSSLDTQIERWPE